MQKNSRVAVAERASARYMISLAFALTFAVFIASIGSNTSLIRAHLSLANEIPAAGVRGEAATIWFLDHESASRL